MNDNNLILFCLKPAQTLMLKAFKHGKESNNLIVKRLLLTIVNLLPNKQLFNSDELNEPLEVEQIDESRNLNHFNLKDHHIKQLYTIAKYSCEVGFQVCDTISTPNCWMIAYRDEIIGVLFFDYPVWNLEKNSESFDKYIPRDSYNSYLLGWKKLENLCVRYSVNKAIV